jgi:hypothetical protein
MGASSVGALWLDRATLLPAGGAPLQEGGYGCGLIELGRNWNAWLGRSEAAVEHSRTYG